MTADEVPVVPVSNFLIGAVLESEPIPNFPLFDDAPLTLERLEDKAAWPNGGRRKKARAVWQTFVAEVNAILRRRNDKLLRLLLTEGVALAVPPLEDWAAGPSLDLRELDLDRCKPGTLKLLYIHHLLPEPMDKLRLLVRVMAASGLKGTLIDQVQALFQEALGAVKGI